MKTLTLIIITLSSIVVRGQWAQSFDKLPENNKMVVKSIEVYKQLLKSDTNNLLIILDKTKTTIQELNQSLTNVSEWVPMDTLMIEYYSNNRTEISFRLRCKENNKNIDYWIKTKSEGVSGSTKDFMFWVKKDEKFSKMEDLIMNVKIKK